MLQYIGVGLSKTGTSSLYEAFKILGYNSQHYLNHHMYRHLVTRTAGYNYDFVDDFPICIRYKQLSGITPNLKAILTVRNVDSWIESCRSEWAHGNSATVQNHWNEWKLEMFGTTQFDEDTFRKVYQQHIDDVKAFYDNDSHRLLIMDIPAGDGWEKLCPFIGVDVPNIPFPFANKTEQLLSAA